MAKVKWFDWYWSTLKPNEAVRKLNRKQMIKNGASTKGAEIAMIEAGKIVTIDLNEHWDGWYRIVRVQGCDPVPEAWDAAQSGRLIQDREAWTDQTGLSPVEDTEPPEPYPEPNVGRVWKYEVTVKEILVKK